METPAPAMEAALPAPAPTAPTEGAGESATQPPAGITPVVDPTITQSTPIGPNLSLQSLQDGTYRLVSENSLQVIDKTMYDDYHDVVLLIAWIVLQLQFQDSAYPWKAKYLQP